jgi:predicted branched-subunit amino acid permease
MATSDRRPTRGNAEAGEPPPADLAPVETRRRLWSQLAVLAAVNTIVGTTVGATSVAAGLSVTMTIVLTVLLFAGAAQLAALAVLMASGPLVTAWLVVMLVNARFLILGASLAPRLGMGLGQRIFAAYLLVDPVALLAGIEDNALEARRTYWKVGIVVFSSWSLGGVLGASGVAQVGNMAALGLDVALPALLLAMLANGLRDRKNLLAAVAGAGITLCTLPLVSPGVAVLLASLGALAPLAHRARRRPQPAPGTPPSGTEVT